MMFVCGTYAEGHLDIVYASEVKSLENPAVGPSLP
jgi:hypothetical protein